MRSIINKLLLGTMTVASVACTGNYADINSNPYQPGDLSADDYALGSAMNNRLAVLFHQTLIQRSLQTVC